MLSGAYFALFGAKVLAVPTRLGQYMTVTTLPEKNNLIFWQSRDVEGQAWLDVNISLSDLQVSRDATGQSEGLLAVLRALRVMKPELFTTKQTYHIETCLEFERDWGLGSSSTLVSLVAQWAGVDALELNRQSLGGSGYDVACATAKQAIVYKQGKVLEETLLPIDFKDRVVFVHLNKKQDTRQAVQQFNTRGNNWATEVALVNTITDELTKATQLADWMRLKQEEENLIATATGLTKVQDIYFKDFPGLACSLGAWGGDFVLLLSEQDSSETVAYCRQRGFKTTLLWHEILLPA